MGQMFPQIEIYEAMGRLSAQMVTAAQSKDWDRLVELEKSVVALRNELQANGDPIRLPALQADRKRALIQQILADDAEVRRHTEPWMEHLKQFMGEQNTRRQVERAYGGGF